MPGGLALEAIGISVIRKDRLILDNVSFTAQPGKLTAIIGPNGAGKTTLMAALSGQKPEAGAVFIGGASLYDDPEYWLRQIGYVPVDNVLHLQLGLRQALIYLGRLRLPECSEAEVERRVDTVLGEFGFQSEADRRKRLGVLSTGERKRANICAELLSEPPVLLLDEPTSNLDPDAERFLMTLLQRRAHSYGQTIVVITHTLNTIHVCDEVVYIANSRLVAAGPRLAVLEQLERDRPSANATLTEFDRWANTFEEHETLNRPRIERRATLIQKRSEAASVIAQRGDDREARRAARLPAPKDKWREQLRTLLSRYHAVRKGDRGSLFGTLLAGFTGVLFLILPADTFVRPGDSAELGQAIMQARQSVYVIALVVALLGLIFTYSEISREFRIYRHERLKGLSPSAYFLAKWLWLVPALGVLAPTLLLFFIVIVYRQPLPDFPTPPIGDPAGVLERIYRYQVPGLFSTGAPWVILITLVLGCVTSLTIGLLISALAADSERGVVYLAFVAVFNVIFAGLLRNPKLQELVTNLSYFATGKWAFEGFASTINIYCWLQGWRLEEFNSTGHLLSVWLALVIFTMAAACLTIVALRWRDPWHRGLHNLGRLFSSNAVLTGGAVALLVVLTLAAGFLREQSRRYHEMTYYSDPDAGGTGAVIYGNLQYASRVTRLQFINGTLSQSWCGVDSGAPAGEIIEEGEATQ